jgi:hypothetical protein
MQKKIQLHAESLLLQASARGPAGEYRGRTVGQAPERQVWRLSPGVVVPENLNHCVETTDGVTGSELEGLQMVIY